MSSVIIELIEKLTVDVKLTEEDYIQIKKDRLKEAFEKYRGKVVS